jgi:hypothetical protein
VKPHETWRTVLRGPTNCPNRAWWTALRGLGQGCVGVCQLVGSILLFRLVRKYTVCVGPPPFPPLRILHLQKCKLSTYSPFVYCILCIYIAGMFVNTFDFVEDGIPMSTNQEGNKKIQDKNQRHILRDRRPSTTTCSACWAMGTNQQRIEKVYSRKKNILYWADWSSQHRTKISCTGTTRLMNQPRKDPFHLSSFSPHSPQFQQSAGATPL